MARRLCRVAALAATAALLAGCGGTPFAAGDAPSTSVARVAIRAAHAGRHSSWMQPHSASSGLLYVSDPGTGDVDVYAYPGGNLVGVLTGFAEPQGECAGAGGSVWIADTRKSRLVEYPHAGTAPIATLEDPGEYPSGCAVDSHGNLAATNLLAAKGDAGSVSWYAGAKGKPTIITSADFAELYFAGFDRNGNLFVDGWPPNFAQAAVGEIRHGTSALVAIRVTGGTIAYPGGVQVRENTVDVGDQVNDAIFHLDENGTVTGITPLDDAADCVQGVIVRKTFVCPDSVNGDVEFFRFPAGGAPKRVTHGLSEPTGAALSP